MPKHWVVVSVAGIAMFGTAGLVLLAPSSTAPATTQQARQQIGELGKLIMKRTPTDVCQLERFPDGKKTWCVSQFRPQAVTTKFESYPQQLLGIVSIDFQLWESPVDWEMPLESVEEAESSQLVLTQMSYRFTAVYEWSQHWRLKTLRHHADRTTEEIADFEWRELHRILSQAGRQVSSGNSAD